MRVFRGTDNLANPTSLGSDQEKGARVAITYVVLGYNARRFVFEPSGQVNEHLNLGSPPDTDPTLLLAQSQIVLRR
jgi:hypothetical protein